MSVIGSISIKDNVTATLRIIKKEQTSFREDVKKTREEMEKTWKEKYQAKLDATPATKALNSLKSKMEPLRKKVVTAMAVKDMATTKVKAVESRVKDLGKKVAEPVVKIKDATGKGISAISGKMKELGTKVVIPVAIAAATATTAVVGASVSEGAKLEQSVAVSRPYSRMMRIQSKRMRTKPLKQRDYQQMIIWSRSPAFQLRC